MAHRAMYELLRTGHAWVRDHLVQVSLEEREHGHGLLIAVDAPFDEQQLPDEFGGVPVRYETQGRWHNYTSSPRSAT